MLFHCFLGMSWMATGWVGYRLGTWVGSILWLQTFCEPARQQRLDSICLPSGFFFFLSCLCTKCVLLWMGRTWPHGRSVALIYVLVKPLEARLSCSCSRLCELLWFVRSSVMARLICLEPKVVEVYNAVVLDCFHQRRHCPQILVTRTLRVESVSKLSCRRYLFWNSRLGCCPHTSDHFFLHGMCNSLKLLGISVMVFIAGSAALKHERYVTLCYQGSEGKCVQYWIHELLREYLLVLGRDNIHVRPSVSLKQPFTIFTVHTLKSVTGFRRAY